MKEIYIVGEDDVTKAVIRRLIQDYAPALSIKGELPARGGQLKSLIKNFNILSADIPVVLLEDLDTEDCAPLARKKLIGTDCQEEDFLINIAVDEAEAWLYADVTNLATYLKVPQAAIPPAKPLKMGGPHARLEVDTDQKTSRHLTKELILKSTDSDLRQRIHSIDDQCKGKEYNPALLPFIEKYWNPEVARQSSYSLHTTIERIQRLNNKYLK